MMLGKSGLARVAAVLCMAALSSGEEARIVFTHALPVLDGGRLQAQGGRGHLRPRRGVRSSTAIPAR